jgi:hypothetical protein
MQFFASAPNRGDEIRVLQNFQMFADGLARHIDSLAQIGKSLTIFAPQFIQQLPSAFIRKRLENVVHCLTRQYATIWLHVNVNNSRRFAAGLVQYESWMKFVSKIALATVIGVAASAVVCGGYVAWKRHAVQATRRQLHAEGFKIDLSEFRGAFAPEAIARGEAVLNADIGTESVMSADIRAPVYVAANTFRMETTNSVVVPWREEFYAGPKKRSPWPAVRQTVEKHRIALAAATAALIEGPVAFRQGAEGEQEKRPWSDQLPFAAKTFGVSVLCNLYYRERADAWTNLLALTHLVTRCQLEAVNHKQRTYFQLMPIAYVATWHALQDHGWSDEQLAALQAEWSQVDFFHELPASAGYERAMMAPIFEQLRGPEPDEEGRSLRDLLKQPKHIPGVIAEDARMAWYRWARSYDDERALLLFFRDREIDLRRACEAPTLIAMQSLRSVTNAPVFKSPYAPNARVTLSSEFYFFESRNGKLVGALGFAADAEIRRRILITAIALERFKLRTGAYPKQLSELTNVDRKVLIDFVDGQSLRYRRTASGEFLLYSVGLDLFDDGGNGLGFGTNGIARSIRSGIPKNFDILWPLPADLRQPADAGNADR